MAHTVHDITLGATPIRQVSNVNHADNGNVIMARSSGEADAAEQYGGLSDPVTQFTSTDIETLLGLNSGTFVSAGLCISATASEFPFKGRADCATFASGAAHPAIAGNNCFVVPTSLRAVAESDDPAEVQCDVHWKSTSSLTNPVAGSTGNTLAAVAFVNGWGFGKVFVNGGEITEVQNVTVNPGITLLKKRSGGGPFPVSVYIVQRDPSIEIVTENLDAVMTRIGYVAAGGNVDVYFRKRADQSSFLADASLAHARLRMADGLQRANAISVNDNGNGTGTITINGLVLTSATSVAIP